MKFYNRLSRLMLKIFGFMNVVDSGEIQLLHGKHEIEIPTNCSPSKVWITCVSHEKPVCYGNVDMFGFHIIQDGFVLYADVTSDSVEIFWIAVD